MSIKKLFNGNIKDYMPWTSGYVLNRNFHYAEEDIEQFTDLAGSPSSVLQFTVNDLDIGDYILEGSCQIKKEVAGVGSIGFENVTDAVSFYTQDIDNADADGYHCASFIKKWSNAVKEDKIFNVILLSDDVNDAFVKDIRFVVKQLGLIKQ